MRPAGVEFSRNGGPATTFSVLLAKQRSASVGRGMANNVKIWRHVARRSRVVLSAWYQ